MFGSIPPTPQWTFASGGGNRPWARIRKSSQVACVSVVDLGRLWWSPLWEVAWRARIFPVRGLGERESWRTSSIPTTPADPGGHSAPCGSKDMERRLGEP